MNRKLQIAIERWDLAKIETVYVNYNGAVYFALSEKFGDVVLKVNGNKEVLKGEYRALEELQGSCFSRVYACDLEVGMFLEERVLPGTVLRNVEDVNQRLSYFTTIFQDICHRETTGYPTYLDWLYKAYACCCNGKVSSVVLENISKALAIGKEMFKKYPERVLLHGDLHHDNILLSREGIYKVIDPKGVIGPVIFDIPRFVLNEVDLACKETGQEHIKYVICRLAEILDFDREDLAKLFFMEAVLEAAWRIEDGEEADWEAVALAETCS